MAEYPEADRSAAQSNGRPSSQQFTSSSLEVANPEADSYRYIEIVLEALFVLGKLNTALDTVTQRVTSEIHHLIETTLDEVEERYVDESN
jgi:exocyst complex component 4